MQKLCMINLFIVYLRINNLNNLILVLGLYASVKIYILDYTIVKT